MEQLLSTKQAARIMGLSHRTLERYRLTGQGPAYRKLGGRVVYHPADLERWIEAARRSSTSDPGPDWQEAS